MSETTITDLDQSKIKVLPHGEEVCVITFDIYAGEPAEVRLTPGQAVRLSRALVKAAAEALGVEV